LNVAVRKETIKQQFNEALPVLEPGERVLGGAYGVSGPNPCGPRVCSDSPGS
jgi:hypothetical protein